MVLHDFFFWTTLIFGIILLLQLLGVAIYIGPAYRAYRSLSKTGAYQKQSTLRAKLGKIR